MKNQKLEMRNDTGPGVMGFGSAQLRIAQDVVEQTLAELPPEIADAVREVSIFLECRPDGDDLGAGVGQDWLGIFEGAARDEVGHIAPPRIRLWAENIWAFASARNSRFRSEVRLTLLHEIGHYLGLSETEIEERGLG